MKRILYLSLALTALLFASCTTVRKTASTSDIRTEVMQYPTVADLDVLPKVEQTITWNFVPFHWGQPPLDVRKTNLQAEVIKAAGADVTHLDSVRQVVTWARHNMEISSLDGIRWTIDDALKYVIRQVRRGACFDGIILDPPAYGRGPDGERWKLDECLNDILKGCARILAPMNSFLVLNLYSNGYSAMLADTLVACAFGPAGRRTSGELVLQDDFGRILPLSVYTRLER